MNMIQVSAHGLRREETAGFIIDRPYGLGNYLLVRFHSLMEVLTGQGLVLAEPGCCILFSPGHPHWYRGRAGAWVNDWMHLEGRAVSEIAAHYALPLDTLLAPGDTRFFPRIFEEIAHEQHHAEDNWEEAVELLVRQLLLKLARARGDSARRFSPAEAQHLPALRALRRHVHEQLARHWTVGEMAANVGLSPSRFAALYQCFFAISPIEDLLRARLQHAENLLTNRAMSVSEAARQSGFASVHYFSRVFHQRIGCAPSDYHRRGKPR
ncbi:MAG TPA: AraC family transcriptional regulator [Abditibacteriaceae bacterium]|jgi:AraC-like DNA-binding protein